MKLRRGQIVKFVFAACVVGLMITAGNQAQAQSPFGQGGTATDKRWFAVGSYTSYQRAVQVKADMQKRGRQATIRKRVAGNRHVYDVYVYTHSNTGGNWYNKGYSPPKKPQAPVRKTKGYTPPRKPTEQIYGVYHDLRGATMVLTDLRRSGYKVGRIIRHPGGYAVTWYR